MSQQDRVPSENSDSSEIRRDVATEAHGDTSDMTAYLFSQLPQPAPGEPVRLLRVTPIAWRAWPFFVGHCRDQKKREPPGATPHYCDRCKP